MLSVGVVFTFKNIVTVINTQEFILISILGHVPSPSIEKGKGIDGNDGAECTLLFLACRHETQLKISVVLELVGRMMAEQCKGARQK